MGARNFFAYSHFHHGTLQSLNRNGYIIAEYKVTQHMKACISLWLELLWPCPLLIVPFLTTIIVIVFLVVAAVAVEESV